MDWGAAGLLQGDPMWPGWHAGGEAQIGHRDANQHICCMGWVMGVQTEPFLNTVNFQMNSMGEGKLRHGAMASSSGERCGGWKKRWLSSAKSKLPMFISN